MTVEVITLTREELRRIVGEAVAEGVRKALEQTEPDPTDGLPPWLTSAQVGELTGYSARTVVEKMHAGLLPQALNNVRPYKWNRDEIRKWIKKQGR